MATIAKKHNPEWGRCYSSYRRIKKVIDETQLHLTGIKYRVVRKGRFGAIFVAHGDRVIVGMLVDRISWFAWE